MTYGRYMATLAESGGIVEEVLQGDDVLSPSVQLATTRAGDVEVLSTHDQLLGGPNGQTFLGARFPADPAYAPLIGRLALRIGRRLAGEGVRGQSRMPGCDRHRRYR